MNSISKTAQTNERNLWNLCRFCGAQHNQDNPLNELFLEVTKKLFSFSIETLKTYKNCDECYAHIEYICKFYKQVENVSQKVFKIKISTKVDKLPPLVILNSNSIFKGTETKDSGSAHKDESDNFCKTTEVKHNTFYSLQEESNEHIIKVKEVIDIDQSDILCQIGVPNNKEIAKFDVGIGEVEDVSKINIIHNKDITEVFHVDELDDNGIKVVNNPCLSPQRQNETSGDDTDGNETQQIIETRDPMNEVENALNHRETCSNNKFECEICGKILCSSTRLKFHRKLHMTEEEKQAHFFKCRFCSKMYPQRGTLESHIKNKHTEKKKEEYACNTCVKIFENQSSLRLHQKVFHKTDFQQEIKNDSERKHKCELCEKFFKRKYHLKQHQIVHMTDEQKQVNAVKCPYCDNMFSSRPTMRYHVVHKHLNHKKQYKKKKVTCDICNKVLSCRSTFLLHVKRVHYNITGVPKYKQKQFTCEICGKILAKYNLKVHQIAHMSDAEKEQSRIHKCPHCDAKYFRRDSLMVHIRSKHSKENPFVCKICEKVFAYRSCLKLHQKTFHDKIKPEWRCEICSKTFLHKRSLSNHKKKIHEQCE